MIYMILYSISKNDYNFYNANVTKYRINPFYSDNNNEQLQQQHSLTTPVECISNLTILRTPIEEETNGASRVN